MTGRPLSPDLPPLTIRGLASLIHRDNPRVHWPAGTVLRPRHLRRRAARRARRPHGRRSEGLRVAYALKTRPETRGVGRARRRRRGTHLPHPRRRAGRRGMLVARIWSTPTPGLRHQHVRLHDAPVRRTAVTCATRSRSRSTTAVTEEITEPKRLYWREAARSSCPCLT
jgi:hypothetical protein